MSFLEPETPQPTLGLDFFIERKRGWQIALPRDGTLFRDLGFFCRNRETIFHVNPSVMATLEGRRQVFLWIQQHMELSIEDLQNIYPHKETYYG